MFSIFQKKKEVVKEEVILTACTTGTQIPLTEVKDEVFATKMMGEGIAFQLHDQFIYAPCEGEVTLIPASLHAIGIKADNGAEILIHVGLDTVMLQGKGFKSFIKQGQHIKQGDCLLQIDLESLKSQNIDLTTMMIVTNSKEYDINIITNTNVTNSDNVMTCKKL